MTHPLFNLARRRQNGLIAGIPSFCCSNRFAIEAILEQSKRFDDKVLIEATSNQVNQFGGYIGMKPADFRNYIYQIADDMGYDKNNPDYSTIKAEFLEYQSCHPDAVHPVFIIGSEVPIPGGAQEEEKMHVTSPDDFVATIESYKYAFAQNGISDLFKYVIAVVVQPGVEFGDGEVHRYNRMDAFGLTEKLREYPDLLFEGHSTDYQSAQSLRQMVEDGIAILKVGPALTFAVRRGLFALAKMEDELIEDASSRSHFIQVLDDVMVENPKDWKKYYHGSEKYIALARKYSYSDRCRYYMGDTRVQKAIHTLLENLNAVDIPMGMLEQYMPIQFVKVRDGKLSKHPAALVRDCVLVVIEDYNYATKHNYMISSIFNN